jgi:hypothetical protein
MQISSFWLPSKFAGESQASNPALCEMRKVLGNAVIPVRNMMNPL